MSVALLATSGLLLLPVSVTFASSGVVGPSRRSKPLPGGAEPEDRVVSTAGAASDDPYGRATHISREFSPSTLVRFVQKGWLAGRGSSCPDDRDWFGHSAPPMRRLHTRVIQHRRTLFRF